MLDRIKSALSGKNGYVEVRIQRKVTNRISYRRGEVDKLVATTDIGGFVRALADGGGWGTVTFNSLDKIEKSVDDAIAASKAINPPKPIKLAKTEPVQDTVKTEIKDDPRDHSIAEKVEMVKKYNEIVIGHDERIIDARTIYGDSYSDIWYGNTDGTFIESDRLDVLLIGDAVAKEGSNVQKGHKSFTSRDDFSFITGREKDMNKLAKLAIDLLSAAPVKGGKYDVVLDPNLAGVFIHEAFGHLSEADHIVENPQAREMMTLGRKFGPEILNVYDEGPVMPVTRGTIQYDDEGVPAQKTALIEKGVLVGRLHDRETAGKMGEKPTGNCRAQDYNHPPIVRMTNTYIDGGDTSFYDMIKDIKLGIYAIDAYGGQTMMENFSFSAGHAYMIRDGKLAEMVKDVVLQGNVFQTLANVTAIGDDFRFLTGGGTCGKGGQMLPVNMGSPHIRIKDVMIGGK